MSALTDDLKKEHSAVKDLIEKIRKMEIGSPEQIESLKKIKDALLAHLKKEDEHLYPVLKKKMAEDKRLASTVEWFINDMDKVSKEALDFFEKYTKEGSDLSSFPADFGKFVALLSDRIRKEETTLYPAYDKVVGV